MAKHPVPGAVKTRLAAVLGAEGACGLYQGFVLDLAERLAALPYPVTWAFWPPTASFAALLPGVRCRPQRGGDLGERMANAVADAFGERPVPVVVIGADAPHVPAERLAEAEAALAAGIDLVLGPAEDGGYYLMGLRRPTPALFSGIAWGTATVLAATRERARALDLRTRLLPSTFDVDEPRDLLRLRAVLAAGGAHLPRTAAFLARCPPGWRW